MENSKPNKKLLIAVCAIIVIAIVAIVSVVAIKSSQKKNLYKEQIKEFATALEDSEKMEKFVEEKVNLRAWYAMNQLNEDENLDTEDEKVAKEAFEKAYSEAKESDYASDENKQEAKFAFAMLAMYTATNGDDVKVEVKDIGKLKDGEDNYKFLKQADFTLKFTSGDNSTEGKWKALFYDDKIIMALPADEENSSDNNDYDFDSSDTEVDWDYEE